MGWLQTLQNRWNLRSGRQVLLVLLTFACTGTTVLYLKAPLFWLLGISKETSPALRTIVYIVAILPAYQILLLAYGFLFGQFRFFWEFEKKMLRRMRLWR